jgi:hypothetical protein
MNLPLYMKDVFSYPTGLVLGVLIGFGFGFVLERSGFGRSTVLAAQFYFRDMRVLKVMFSAIVTALLGMTLLSGLGLLDRNALQVPPTFLWPQLVGGLLLGIGFIVSGYCPGTAVVAFASGKLDGLAAMFGVMGGSLAFGLVHPHLEGFYLSGSMGTARLPELLRLPEALLAVAVALMAIGAFIGGEKVERIFAAKDGGATSAPSRAVRRRVFGTFAAAAFAGLLTLLLPHGEGAAPEKPVGTIDAIALARLAIEDPTSYFLVDVRSPSVSPEGRIPGALAAPEEDAAAGFFASLPATRRLIVYAEDDLANLPAAARRFPGEVAILEGGYREFDEKILRSPTWPETSSPEEVEAYKAVAALHAFFTGTEARAEAPPVQARPAARAVAQKKGGGC